MKVAVASILSLASVSAAAHTVAYQASPVTPTNNTEIASFCSNRPAGLYCSPWSIHQKVECPTGEFFTCPKGDAEFCQERGILREYGFKGGIARCVPYIAPSVLTAFCIDKKSAGVFCFGDKDNNIRVQCPTGLIYKCDNNPTASTKKCDQTKPAFATCKLGGGGGVVDVCSSTLAPAVTVTVTRVRTRSAECPPTPYPVVSTVTESPVTNTVYSTVENTVTNVYTTVQMDTKTVVSTQAPVTETFTAMPVTTTVTLNVTEAPVTDVVTATYTLSPVTATITETAVRDTVTDIKTKTRTSTEAPVTNTVTATSTQVPVTNTVTATSTQAPVTETVTMTKTKKEHTTTSSGSGGVVGTASEITLSSTSSSTPCSGTVMPTTSTTSQGQGGAVGSATEITLTTASTTPCSETVMPTTTSTQGQGGVVGSATEITFTTSTVTPVQTSSSSAQGGVVGSATEITPTPTSSPCSPNQLQTSIATPPGLSVTLALTSTLANEADATTMCQTMGGEMLQIGSADEHFWLGQQICTPMWYKTWETNSYSTPNACIALYPGGATAVPTQGCDTQLLAICAIPNN